MVIVCKNTATKEQLGAIEALVKSYGLSMHKLLVKI